jgi:glycine cleavage system H lipoate-binding protein
MKKINEEILRKDSSVNKVQFDKEWFYSIKDMTDYLNEDLTGVEYIHLPMIIDEVKYTVKCATLEDILRFLKKEPLEDFRGSVLRSKKPPLGKKKK